MSQNLRKEVVSFFEAEGRFRQRKHYGGMAASAADELFLQFFLGLSNTEKDQVAGILISIGLEEDAPDEFVIESILLIGRIGQAVGGRCFLPFVPKIIRVLTDEDRLEHWLGPELSSGRVSRNDPRFASSLLFALYHVDADSAEEVWEVLESKARASEFLRYLENVKIAFLASREAAEPSPGSEE